MLEQLLDLEAIGSHRFTTRNHQESFRKTIFGGQVLAQALMAAGRTVRNRPAHSLHAYFLRAGHPNSPVEFTVEHLRDGKNFSARSVNATQDSRLILTLHASFHAPEAGFEHQPPAPADGPTPTALRAAQDGDPSHGHTIGAEFSDPPLDYLPFNNQLKLTTAQSGSEARCWTRARGPLPSTALHHLCALAFASDVALLASALLPHEASLFSDNIFPASIDHSLWFHRVPGFSDWHQYVTDSPWAANARALCRGQFFDRAGNLTATVVQEGLLRPKKFPLEPENA